MVKWGYEVVSASEGQQAWGILQGHDAPRLAILDWMMPGKDGIDICRCIRQRKGGLASIVTHCFGMDVLCGDYFCLRESRAESLQDTALGS